MSKSKEPIINRVAQSKLVTFDLEDYYPEGGRVILDIKDWLHEGLMLKEKEFRSYVANHNWEQYKDTFVAMSCSTGAIVPGWAYMLVATKLQPYVKKVIIGDLQQLEAILYQSIIENLDVSAFKDRPVIIKGCSNKPVPPNAYLWATCKLQPHVKSLMYGEACASVPLFKK